MKAIRSLSGRISPVLASYPLQVTSNGYGIINRKIDAYIKATIIKGYKF